MAAYSNRFFYLQKAEARKSAEAIVPLILDLVSPVDSVIDLGCGTGAWLSVFVDLGITDVLGVDGDYVNPDLLEISRDRFVAWDLRNPYRPERRFDLAISLEVAEHLPPLAGEALVESLTQSAPTVLFSAAIPHQGGTDHINEQWPDYWACRFERRVVCSSSNALYADR